MLAKLLVGLSLMALCVVVHALGVTAALRRLRQRMGRGGRGFGRSAWRLVRMAGWTILLHLAQIVIWAPAYTLGGAMRDFNTAAYFSAVTYTTTGYGDLVLPEAWRLVGGIEALTGILMCGLSTGMFFAAFLRVFDFERDTAD